MKEVGVPWIDAGDVIADLLDSYRKWAIAPRSKRGGQPRRGRGFRLAIRAGTRVSRTVAVDGPSGPLP
jgi:hypothetical protein